VNVAIISLLDVPAQGLKMNLPELQFLLGEVGELDHLLDIYRRRGGVVAEAAEQLATQHATLASHEAPPLLRCQGREVPQPVAQVPREARGEMGAPPGYPLVARVRGR
jgi:hypothetical protein